MTKKRGLVEEMMEGFDVLDDRRTRTEARQELRGLTPAERRRHEHPMEQIQKAGERLRRKKGES